MHFEISCLAQVLSWANSSPALFVYQLLAFFLAYLLYSGRTA